MLILTRHAGRIGDEEAGVTIEHPEGRITVWVLSPYGARVRIGIDAPISVRIMRPEAAK